MTETPASPSTPGTPDHKDADPLWPVETDIYILPDGRVVIADLPAELAGLAASLGLSDDLPAPTDFSPL
jgi:hypothetical protein